MSRYTPPRHPMRHFEQCVRALFVTTLVTLALAVSTAIATRSNADVAVPGMQSGVVEAQPCNNWSRYTFGWSSTGAVLVCVSFDDGRSGMWSRSATLVGVQQPGGSCKGLDDRYGGVLAQAPDGRPMRCGGEMWVALNGNYG